MKIKEFPHYSEQWSKLGKHVWAVSRLIDLTKGLDVVEFPIDAINVYHIYEKVSLREMVGHVKAVMDADLSFPIILDEDGDIMDGRHRIMKAIMQGEKTIKAVRLEHNPSPDKIEEEKNSGQE